MKGYLLDTNILDYWIRKDKGVHERIEALAPKTPLRISVITLGEIEYGHMVESPKGRTPIQTEYKKFIQRQLPAPLLISSTTSMYYGQVRARLFDKFAPKKAKNKKLRPEQLLNPATGLQLGIQENDIWIAAQAIERGLVLISNDKHMKRIVEVYSKLQLTNWAR